ncbi:MAG: hypothetical protein AAFR91_10455 [Pseudomonadota bacterium]
MVSCALIAEHFAATLALTDGTTNIVDSSTIDAHFVIDTTEQDGTGIADVR